MAQSGNCERASLASHGLVPCKACRSIDLPKRGLPPARDALAHAFGQSDAQLPVDNLDRHRPQTQARVALVTSRRDVKLIPVPRTGDFGVVLGEGQAWAGFAAPDHLLDPGDDL